MAYKLTPADRRAQAALIRAEREARYLKNKPLAARVAATGTQQKKKANTATKVLHTAGDVGANLVTGLGKGLEGIYDLGAGLVGAVGGLFSDKFEDDVKAHIAKDHVGEWFGNDWQEALDQSALNDSTVGGIIEGVAQGVGQMLPAVAVTLIPGVGPALGTKLALGTTMASAAGTGTEQAFKDGAGYGQGLAYGAASGAIEGVTEKLLPGAGDLYGKAITKMGKSAAKEIASEVAEVGIKRVAKEALGEGAEEMLAELANPALKSIYKGKDALEEYGDSEYWKGVAEAGVVGMGTSVAYSGTVGRATKTTGPYADARSTLEHIGEQRGKIATGELTIEQEVQAQKNIKADYEQLSRRLVKASDKIRADVLKNPQLAAAFDADGTIKAEFSAQLDNSIKAAGDTSHGFNREYYSATARGREAEIAEGLAREGTKIYDGTLTASESENLNRLRKVHAALSRKGLVGTDFVLSEESPKFNSYLDGKTVVIGKDTLTDGTYIQKLVHEVEHFTEGTKEWAELASFVFDNSAETNAAIDTVMNSGYGITEQDIAMLGEGLNSGKLTRGQQTLISEVVALRSEALFGSEQAIAKLTKENRTLAGKILDRIKQFLEVFTAKTPEEKAQVKRLQEAQRLFERALGKAGTRYAAEALTRENAGNMQVSSEGNVVLDGEGEVQYNYKDLYTTTDEYMREVAAEDRSDFDRWLANKTSDMQDGEFKAITIYCYRKTYFFAADGYMHGTMASTLSAIPKSSIAQRRKDFINELDKDTETSNLWANIVSLKRAGSRNDIFVDGDTDTTRENDSFFGASREGNGTRDTERSGENYQIDNDEVERIIKGLREMLAKMDEEPERQYSRKQAGDVVTLSKGEMAKLHANYAGEKVFDKGAVIEAMKGVEAWKRLPVASRNDFVARLWSGYNARLHQQGFEQFTEVMWHKLHAEILQENGFEMSEDEIRVMDEQIVNALHAIVASGKPSVRAKLESATSTEGYRKQAEFWREEHGRAVERHKMLNTLKYELEKLANQKKGRYVNAANFRGDSFKIAIDELAKMNWRGGLVNDTKIREHFAALAAFYTKKNPLYAGDGNGNELFRQEIADALADLGNSQNGALTVEDLYAAETVVKYFAHEIEAHNTVYKDGKRVDAMPEVKRYIERADRAKMIATKCGMWSNLMRSSFARLVADPAMLMRQADGYLSGFFTEQYEQLRQGTIDANVKEREVSEEFERFWDEHKAYGKRYNDATVTFNGAKMPLQEAISLYMTMHREHAFAGLAGAGFEIDGKQATENISDGFADDVQKQIAEDLKELPSEEFLTLTKSKNAELERAALKKVVEKKRTELYDQFTAEDKALIEIMERGYEACREIKVRVDEIVQGYSNVTGGYYYPIRRTGLAESVDAYTGFEGDRVTNLSMNKETVKNAHKLYIEPAHVVYMRHLKATSLYHGLGVFTDNFNRLYNLNTGTNANNPITVRTALASSNKYVKEMVTYFKELKQDVEGISKKRNTEKFYNDAVAFIRSSYATFQLGANPKVWVTQFSSLLAASNLLDMDSITKGLTVGGKDVDEYCRLAWLRNNDDAAAMAQAVSTPTNAVQRAGRNALQKVRDLSMKMIGKVDRLVITRLFGACQLQVEKNGGAKVGTKENKIEAGKLLQRVILETQQNSLATERSAAMRSGDELLKGFTMFSADAMKVGARFVDAFGELSVLRTLLKEANKAGDTKEAERLTGEIKRARKQCVRACVALVGVAIFNAALAYGFKWLYRRDEDESVGTVVADTFGNMLGGIPFVRDAWGFFQDGFEMDHFLISTVNDVLGTAAASFQLVSDAAQGKEVTRQQALANMRKVLYAAGQLSGVPTRNIYNVTTGALNRVSPTTGYKVEGLFTAKAYASDLEKAIAKDDEKMIGTIAGLMVGEKIGIEDDKMREVLKNLAGEGYSVLPRSVGDTVTLNGEERALTGKQQKRFRTVYAVGEEAVANMCRLKQFAEVDAETQAKAIQFIYGVYWDLALEDVLGEDLAEKNVLFAEAIDIEKLAIIIAQARSLEADKDKNGKAIAGTKKRKVEQFVNSLRLTAAQKYMVMGYLGYTNANGRAQVENYIGGLKLTKTERAALLKYSGYAA